MRGHAHYHSGGTGPLYQGRFTSFPVQEDEPLLSVCRYGERNPRRAQLVPRAEGWPWSSLARRVQSRDRDRRDAWPVPEPADWLEHVNGVETVGEWAALRRGAPYGSPLWQPETAQRLGLLSPLKPLGRPRKTNTAA